MIIFLWLYLRTKHSIKFLKFNDIFLLLFSSKLFNTTICSACLFVCVSNAPTCKQDKVWTLKTFCLEKNFSSLRGKNFHAKNTTSDFVVIRIFVFKSTSLHVEVSLVYERLTTKKRVNIKFWWKHRAHPLHFFSFWA